MSVAHTEMTTLMAALGSSMSVAAAHTQWISGQVDAVHPDGSLSVVLAGSQSPITAQRLASSGDLVAGDVVEVRRQGGYAVVHGKVGAPPSTLAAVPAPPSARFGYADGAAVSGAVTVQTLNSKARTYATGGITETFAKAFNSLLLVLPQVQLYFLQITAMSAIGFTYKLYTYAAEAANGTNVNLSYLAVGQ